MPRDITVSAEAREQFLAAIVDTSEEPVTALQFNSWVAELLAIGDVLLDPSMVVENPPSGATQEQIIRLPQSGGLRVVGSKWSSLWSLNPNNEVRAESERRVWAWACLGTVRGSLDAARYSGGSSGLLIPSTGLVRVADPAVAYVVNVPVAIPHNAAYLQVARGAELYLNRFVVWRQRGAMPAAGDQEYADFEVASEVARMSWERWGQLRPSTRPGQNAIGVLALVGLGLLALGGKNG